MTARETGNSLLRQGDVKEAKEQYEIAIALDRTDFKAWSNLSLVCLKLGLKEEAHKAALECKSCCVESFLPKATARVASAMAAMHEFSDAHGALDEAVSLCISSEDEEDLMKLRIKFHKMEMEAAETAVKKLEEEKDRLQKIIGKSSADEDIKRFLESREALKQASIQVAESQGNPQPLEFRIQPERPIVHQPQPSSVNKVLIQVEIHETCALAVKYEWFGLHTPADADDFVGLYPIDEMDMDNYWNIQTMVGGIRQGEFSMRTPGVDGIFEFRYFSGKRCAGKSMKINVKHNKAIFDCPPYMLLKEPNLLCYWLYMPLLPGNVNMKGTKLKPHIMTSEPDCRIPTMTIENNINVIILAPSSHQDEWFLVPYLNCVLDEMADLDRSTLSFHGDYLATRLSFRNMNTASNAKQARMFLHPVAEELNHSAYGCGIQCRNCKQQVVASLSRYAQNPFSPWVDLLGHLTCIAPEEYQQETTVSKAFQNASLDPSPGTVMIDEAFIEVSPSDTIGLIHSEEMRRIKSPVHETSRGPNTATVNVGCGGCGVWLGTRLENKYPVEIIKYSLYKVFLECGSLYRDSYSDTSGSLVASRLCKLIDETRTVVVSCVADNTTMNCVRLQTWSIDSWISTHISPVLKPVVKVTFTDVFQQQFDGETSFCLANEHFKKLLEQLKDSNQWLPPSARKIGDMKVAFLFW